MQWEHVFTKMFFGPQIIQADQFKMYLEPEKLPLDEFATGLINRRQLLR